MTREKNSQRICFCEILSLSFFLKMSGDELLTIWIKNKQNDQKKTIAIKINKIITI